MSCPGYSTQNICRPYRLLILNFKHICLFTIVWNLTFSVYNSRDPLSFQNFNTWLYFYRTNLLHFILQSVLSWSISFFSLFTSSLSPFLLLTVCLLCLSFLSFLPLPLVLPRVHGQIFKNTVISVFMITNKVFFWNNPS